MNVRYHLLSLWFCVLWILAIAWIPVTKSQNHDSSAVLPATADVQYCRETTYNNTDSSIRTQHFWHVDMGEQNIVYKVDSININSIEEIHLCQQYVGMLPGVFFRQQGQRTVLESASGANWSNYPEHRCVRDAFAQGNTPLTSIDYDIDVRGIEQVTTAQVIPPESNQPEAFALSTAFMAPFPTFDIDSPLMIRLSNLSNKGGNGLRIDIPAEELDELDEDIWQDAWQQIDTLGFYAPGLIDKLAAYYLEELNRLSRNPALEWKLVDESDFNSLDIISNPHIGIDPQTVEIYITNGIQALDIRLAYPFEDEEPDALQIDVTYFLDPSQDAQVAETSAEILMQGMNSEMPETMSRATRDNYDRQYADVIPPVQYGREGVTYEMDFERQLIPNTDSAEPLYVWRVVRYEVLDEQYLAPQITYATHPDEGCIVSDFLPSELPYLDEVTNP